MKYHSQHGHKVRSIIKAKHRVIKDPLNLFFVDLEPSDNNKDIYKLNQLQNSVIRIEPPRRGQTPSAVHEMSIIRPH